MWQKKFFTKCLAKFDKRFCEFQDAMIQSEGGYNPLRWAEWAEGFCSWGMNQNYVCGSQGWSARTAKHIYYVLKDRKPADEYERLKKFAYFLDGDWQIDNILIRAENGMNQRRCKKEYGEWVVVRGQKIHRNIVCSFRQNNWNGYQYVGRVVSKWIELYH